MDKLTKEQAQWLLAKLQDEFPFGTPPTLKIILAVEKIINECTESEITHEEALKYSLAQELCQKPDTEYELRKMKESLQKLWGYFHDLTKGMYR